MSTGDLKSTNEEESSVHPDDLDLLAKLEAANRLLEIDEKSCSAINSAPSPTLTHSRKGSGSSVSTNSSNSHLSAQQSEDDTTKVRLASIKRPRVRVRKKVADNTGVDIKPTVAEIFEDLSGNLWDVWGRLVNDWENVKKKQGAIRDLVRKGIPHPFRGLAWQLLLSVNSSPHKDLYVEYLKNNSPSEKLIRRDIARTFPDHHFFKEKDGLGQESLFNVMKAYSLHDREVGYCQGSGFIVGLLLMQMPEEEAFAVLVKLMQDYRLRELFKPSMAELGLCMYKLECLIQELLPELFLHFQSQGFHTSMYASSWFLTLFCTCFSLSLACRVMDLFISEGMEMIFRIGIAILQTSQDELMSMDMEEMLQFFQKQIPLKYESDHEKLLQAAYLVKYNAKKMKKVEKEYTALKSKENEEQIELRRLRTENRLLRQRIDNLEKESAVLADKLIHDQVTRAQEHEETYALKNTLSTTKQKLADTQKQLNEAQTLIGDIKHRTSSITSASSLDDGEAQSVIQGLQEELIALRIKDADIDSLVKELKSKIKDLEDTNIQLQKAPTNDVQHLQEELIAVKLREAEGNLSLKEMRQKVHDLETHWEKYLAKQNQEDTSSSPKDTKNNKQENKQLQDELMTVKIREANCLSDLKEVKQKLMELETQNHICTNQIRRMDEENKTLKSQAKEAEDKEKELQKQIKDFTRKMDDLQSQLKEESMMKRIQEAEHSEVIGGLKQKIAELEIQKAELQTADQLDSKDGTQDLENRIYDLQDEVFQLKLSQLSPKNMSFKSPNGSHFSDSDEDDDDDVDEDLENPESLNRTLSEIIEGTRRNDSADSSQINGALCVPESISDEGECAKLTSNGEVKLGEVTVESLLEQRDSAKLTPNCDYLQREVTVDPKTKNCNGNLKPGELRQDSNSHLLNGDYCLREETLDSNHEDFPNKDNEDNSCYSNNQPKTDGIVDVEVYKESRL